MLNAEGLANRINAEVRRLTIGPDAPEGENASHDALAAALKTLDADTVKRTDLIDQWIVAKAREIVDRMPETLDMGGEHPVEIVNTPLKAKRGKKEAASAT